ncbi:hypothetical protein [Limnohabitans sp. G3-2]|uniref:hypothetical protein n=1 Tax=Limnohabitans sp. G3-2 TaxID=1100711 RepID=UPI000C1EADB5|nr:hypothetical protein [Limnohabitans sp. G3-2]PIT73903.1 hypothetical protein B9Z31_08545 [Limnohabitans sp. G3-2]
MVDLNKKLDFIAVALSQFFVLIVNIFLISILTKSLSMEMFGYYTLFFTAAIFLRQILYDPISYVIVRDCGQLAQGESVNNKVKAMNVINDGLLFWFGLIFLIAALFAYIKFNELSAVAFALTFYLYFSSNGAGGMALAVLNILKKRRLYGAAITFEAIVKIFILLIIFKIFGSGLLESIVALTLACVLLHILLRLYLKRVYCSNFISSVDVGVIVKSFFINAAPFYLPTFFVALKGVGERWVLAANVGVEDLAIFNVFFQLGFSPVVMIFGVVQTFVAPIVYKLSAKEGGHLIRFNEFMIRLVGGVILLGVVGFFLADTIGSTILKYIVPENYHSHLNLFPMFVVAGVLAAAVGIVHLGVVGAFEAKVAGRLMSIAMISGISISFLSVLGWGFKGAIFGLIASNMVAFFIYSATLHKKVNL